MTTPRELFDTNRHHAIGVAHSAGRRFQIDPRELESFALEGLWQASERFDAAQGLWLPFARKRIFGAIVDGVRTMVPLSRRRHAKAKRLDEASASRVDLGDVEGSLPSEDLGPGDALETLRLRTELEAAIQALPERERALVGGHYLREERFDHVAAALGLSKSWASRLHTRALRTMQRKVSKEWVAA